MGKYKATVIFSDAGSCTYEATVVVGVFTRTVQDKARPKPSMEMEGGHKVL